MFPIEVAKNHPPIINAVSLGGLNLLTIDNPIGLKNNSPIVITKYEEINHQAEDLSAPLLLAYTAPTITKHERPDISNPMAIFKGVDGSLSLLRRKAKKAKINGVSATTQNGFTD